MQALPDAKCLGCCGHNASDNVFAPKLLLLFMVLLNQLLNLLLLLLPCCLFSFWV